MDVRQVGVVGAGQMGNGIAQVFAVAGIPVVMHDMAAERAEAGVATIRKSLVKLVEKQKISAADQDAALARIKTTTTLKDLAGTDLVVEAVVESLAVKDQVFGELARVCREDAVLASNTSSISLTRIARTVRNPGRVIGMHFMNPVPLMALVEIIRALQTTDETCALVESMTRRIGKTPVEVRDAPGFVSNRVLMPMINEAIFCLYEGVAKPEDIDQVMKLGMNHPIGPLALADLIGLDTCLAILQVLYDGFNDSKYRPCPLLRQMVDAGYLGRKTKRGFYSY